MSAPSGKSIIAWYRLGYWVTYGAVLMLALSALVAVAGLAWLATGMMCAPPVEDDVSSAVDSPS
jgi:hypothetical protein